MKDCIIFDIDGTLMDVEHRRHHVAGRSTNWDAFFSEMKNDPPLVDVCYLADLIGCHPLATSGFIDLFLLSGRPDTYYKVTEAQMREHVPAYRQRAKLLMRAEGDHRADTEVKRDFLHSIQADGYNVRFVVDDRPSVIAMWKKEGITVLQIDSGEWDDKPDIKPGDLYMMVGPSGSGKSTYIKRCWKGSEGSVVSSDALRAEFTDDFKDQSKNDQVFFAMKNLVKARITSGMNTMVDATNLRARDRRSLRDLCSDDTKIWYVVVDRPLAEKHRDAGWRDDVMIGDKKLIDKHHMSFMSGKSYVLRGDDDPRVTVYDTRGKL